MSAACRTPSGGEVDRSRLLSFTFDGRRLAGHPGDTVASALLANGIHLMGRSFKYHRPRGVLGAGVEEPNALMGVTYGPGRFEPNARATCVALCDGLIVESQNRWPSLAFDLGAINDLIAPLIPAGFYYKTFMWPRGFWARVYEPVIRRAAGLGAPPTVPDPDDYSQRYAHCETLIVGAGPAGVAAALAASARPGRVMLVDEGERAGGGLRDEPAAVIDDCSAHDWVERSLRVLADRDVVILRRTTAFGYGIGNLVALSQRLTDAGGSGVRERQWQVRAERVILATGAIERPIVFPGNDRPGVMLASAARAFLNRFGVVVGRAVVLMACHDSGYRVAFDLAATGVEVTIADLREEVAEDLLTRASSAGIEVIRGAIPLGTRGRLRVREIAVDSPLGVRRLRCGALLMAGGWTPSVHLFSQSGGKVVWNEASSAFVPGPTAQPCRSVGASRGVFDLAGCLEDAWTAAHGTGSGPVSHDRCDAGALIEPTMGRDSSGKAFVDFQNDVTAKDIRLAVREGFRSVEHIKRFTTNGMATDQGRTSNINALAIAAQAMGVTIPQAGLTTFRAPYTPVTFGTLSGHARGALFEPVRRTPMHDRAVSAGAVFEDVGQWKRARTFPMAGEDLDAAVRRECVAVRNGVGLFDASTLGKIEVVGPDAAAFLDFLYTGRPSSMEVGRCRYAVMLGEDGFIADDGVIGRMGPDRFHVTTTSGGATNVLAVMEDFRQTELPGMRVWLTSTTEQYAVMAVNGPNARKLISPLVEDIEMSDAHFPHMSVREGSIAGVPVRLFRVSFTGELGYEVNVPARHGLAVWDVLSSAGGSVLYGTDASHVLRAEKGYIIVGQETDGTTTPGDVGLAGMVAMKKADFVGKRSLMGPAMLDPARRQLVGLLTEDRRLLDEGQQVVDPRDPGRSIGHVSSAYESAAIARPIALAMIAGGRDRIGQMLAVVTQQGAATVRVVSPVFYDAEGKRLDA